MKRLFRKYHRVLAILSFLPLLLTVITGMLYPIVARLPYENKGAALNLLMRVHTGGILGLDAIYPLLNGMALAGLLITGISMTRLFQQKSQKMVKSQMGE